MGALLLASLHAGAQPLAVPEPIALAMPVQCELAVSCWVANYVDVDPGEGVADFRCGPRTYGYPYLGYFARPYFYRWQWRGGRRHW